MLIDYESFILIRLRIEIPTKKAVSLIDYLSQINLNPNTTWNNHDFIDLLYFRKYM